MKRILLLLLASAGMTLGAALNAAAWVDPFPKVHGEPQYNNTGGIYAFWCSGECRIESTFCCTG